MDSVVHNCAGKGWQGEVHPPTLRGMRRLDPLVTLLAANHQVFGRAQAVAAGISDNQLARWVAAGLLERVCHGTYRLRGITITQDVLAMTAVVAARQGTRHPELVALTRMSAAHRWGMSGRRPGKVHVVIRDERGSDPGLGWLRVHRSRTLELDDIRMVDGVPTTAPARTIADATINLGVSSIMKLIARGLHLELFTLADLSHALRRAGRIHGARRLRLAICRIDPDVRAAASLGEAAGFDALRDVGFDVVRQHPLEVDGQRFRLDLAILSLMLAIEIDGFWWHFDPDHKRRDTQRQNLIVQAGFAPLRFSADDVVRDPSVVVAGVRTYLAQHPELRAHPAT